MHLEGVQIEDFLSVERLQLPLAPLTVLFGPNSAGKSNLLEAFKAGFLQYRGGKPRLDTRSLPTLIYFVRLAGTGIKDHPDRHWLEGVLTAFPEEIPFPDPQDCAPREVDGREIELPKGLGLEDLIYHFIEQCCAAVPDAHAYQAKRFLTLLLEKPLLAIILWDVWLALDRRDLRSDLRTAAEALAQSDLDDRLWVKKAAKLCLDGKDEFVELMVLGWCDQDASFELIGKVVEVQTDPSGLSEDLDCYIQDIHVAFYERPWKSVPAPSWSQERYNDERSLTWEGQSNPWLDSLADGSVRWRSTIRPILQVIEEEANRLAPPFVQTEGHIRLALTPLDALREGPKSIVQLELVDMEKPLLAIHLGSGIRRWIAALVREACRRLVGSRVTVLDHEGQPLDDRGEIVSALIDLKESPDTFASTFRFETATEPAILLVDEPEQHLHVLAQEEVASWLIDRSRENVSVIVATHSPVFLGLPPGDASLVRVRRSNGSTNLKNLDGRLLAEFDELKEAVGLGRCGLLTLVRAVAIVEGLHDKMVIEGLYERELHAQRILVLPLHGTDNASAVIEGEFLAKSGLPIRVMFDRVRLNSVEKHSPRKWLRKEELALKEILNLKEVGADIEPIPYDEPDVICSLPGSAVRRAFPDSNFADWHQIVQRYRSAEPQNFKDFALRDMGLPQVKATYFVKSVLSHVLEGDQQSSEYKRAVAHLFASVNKGWDTLASPAPGNS